MPKILVPVRTEKKYDQTTFREMLDILLEVRDRTKDDSLINKKVVYHMLYMVKFIRQQAKYAQHPESLYLAADEIENVVLEMCNYR